MGLTDYDVTRGRNGASFRPFFAINMAFIRSADLVVSL
jgi:hypothetical protein